MIMDLHYRLCHPSSTSYFPPVLLLHGLFGSLDNLGILARDLSQDRTVIQVDLRNHGLSPHSPLMTYSAMADDLCHLIEILAFSSLDIIGHSMGGKVAMALTRQMPTVIRHLVVLDIAPIHYPRRHDALFTALKAVTDAHVSTRQQAAQILRDNQIEEGVISFLLKSFHQRSWRFNHPVLWQQYDKLIEWQELPPYPGEVLFIRGDNSPYLQKQHHRAIVQQFPQAQIILVPGTGHWLHAEKPAAVLQILHRFLDNPYSPC